ncbi:glutathione S-transferase 3-like [Cyprinus carpio]|uniref:glutathione transferase n=1 Tax=Cyprinus carpio TaxID=7962 RepID=A0A9Q9ZMY9_CYPCA|nr:glutathione S-transferase 3-like [Cyprinus carpio]
MSDKVVLHYFNGRGKMESIRWLLAAAGVQFEEVFLTKREQYEKLLSGIGALMFSAGAFVEIDGSLRAGPKPILNYLSLNNTIYMGKDPVKHVPMIDMYSEGASDLTDLIIMYPFKPAEHKQTHLSTIEQKAKDRFLPVFEKGLADSFISWWGKPAAPSRSSPLEVTLMCRRRSRENKGRYPTISKFLQPWQRKGKRGRKGKALTRGGRM